MREGNNCAQLRRERERRGRGRCTGPIANISTFTFQCDATEASSCSECLSRNVKCQFTKETNRRMSSMKYDLFSSPTLFLLLLFLYRLRI
jgi:hypothetical protein